MAASAEDMAPGRSPLCSRGGWLTWGAPMEKSKECRVGSDCFSQIPIHSFSAQLVTEHSLNASHSSRQWQSGRAESELLRGQENHRSLLWLPGGVWKGSWGTVRP